MTQQISAERGGYSLLRLPHGSFNMGSPESEPGRQESEGPRRLVEVKEFALGKYPVTNEEYQRFLRDNPSQPKPALWEDDWFNGPKQPVVGVAYADAEKYCAWAGLRLPSEAEWEYACRAGTNSLYHCGNTEDSLAEVAWYSRLAERRLHPVGEKLPNAFGLYDMHGNIWEWCEDDWHDDYVLAPAHSGPWLNEPRGELRVVRGGSWFGNTAEYLRSASRRAAPAEDSQFNLGFRCATSL